MSRGSYRGIYCSLFDDPDYQALSAHARHVFLTVRLCAQSGPAAIFRYYVAVIAAQTGLTVGHVDHALDELVKGGWVVRDEVILWVRNGLRHDPMMRLADRKHRVSVERAIEALPHRPIVLSFCDYYEIVRPFIGASKTLRENEDVGSPSTIPSTIPIPSRESSATAAPAPDAPSRVPHASEPAVAGNGLPDHITSALGRAAVLGAVPQLRDAAWWKAEARANPGVPLAVELARAEAWIASNPTRAPRRNHRRFLHSWFSRAERPEGGS